MRSRLVLIRGAVARRAFASGGKRGAAGSSGGAGAASASSASRSASAVRRQRVGGVVDAGVRSGSSDDSSTIRSSLSGKFKLAVENVGSNLRADVAKIVALSARGTAAINANEKEEGDGVWESGAEIFKRAHRGRSRKRDMPEINFSKTLSKLDPLVRSGSDPRIENPLDEKWLIGRSYSILSEILPEIDLNASAEHLRSRRSHPQPQLKDVQKVDNIVTGLICDFDTVVETPHGSMIFQQALNFASPHIRASIVDHITSNCQTFARHLYAGHVVRHAIFAACDDDREKLIDALLPLSPDLVYFTTGAHVVQAAMLMSTEAQREAFVNMAINEVTVWGRNKFATHVVQTAMSISNADEIRRFFEAILPRVEDLVLNYNFNFVLQKLIVSLPQDEHANFVRQLFRTPSMEKLGHTTSGIVTLNRIYENLDLSSARALNVALVPYAENWMVTEYGCNFVCKLLQYFAENDIPSDVAAPLVDRIASLSSEYGKHPFGMQVVVDALALAGPRRAARYRRCRVRQLLRVEQRSVCHIDCQSVRVHVRGRGG